MGRARLNSSGLLNWGRLPLPPAVGGGVSAALRIARNNGMKGPADIALASTSGTPPAHHRSLPG